MINWIKKNTSWLAIVVIILGIYSYNHWYVPYRNLKKGFVIVNTFDCPDYHSIKAHDGSMIYHVPGDTYYARTNAANGECFDTIDNAVKQGYRAPYN